MSLRLPVVQQEPEVPSRSPCCRSGLIRHQRSTRGLTDIRIGEVTVQRYMCKRCRKTFTAHPAGVNRSSVSERVKATAVLLYCLGLSYDSAIIALAALAAPISKGSAYNYVRAAGEAARLLHKKALAGKVRMVGQDTTVFKVKGKKAVASFITDALSGATLAIDLVDDEDAQSLRSCLERVGGADLKLLISDDAGAYRLVAEQMGLEHQLCITHAKKALIRRSKSILGQTPKDSAWRKAIVKDTRWLRKAMAKGKKLTVRLCKRARERLPDYLSAAPPRKGQEATPEYRMRLVLGELVEHGPDLFTYRNFKDSEGRLLLDGTNNACERAIGWCGKIRYRQMRGAKSRRSLKDFLYLNAFLWRHKLTGQGPFQLAALVA